MGHEDHAVRVSFMWPAGFQQTVLHCIIGGISLIIHKIKFSDLIPSTVGKRLDQYFEKNGWVLQQWLEDGQPPGYQVYFGERVQVDNQFEFGFSYLYSREETISFARIFHNDRLNGFCRYRTVKNLLEKTKNNKKKIDSIGKTKRKRYRIK